MSIKLGKIEIYMGPTELGAPDNLEEVIINFIDGTERSLDVAVQELESKPITEALIRARQRKVIVKVVLEGSYLSLRRALKYPFSSYGQNEANRRLHDAILRANINVHTDFNPKIFHQKFIIRDTYKTTAAVLTGSTNFTPTGTAKNLNHIVIVRSKEVAKIYRNEFREIMRGHFGKYSEGRDPLPPEIDVSGVRVKVLFAPDHNPEMEIMKQILKARRRIDFAIFTFSRSSGIDDTMISVCGSKKILVRGAMDGPQSRQSWGAAAAVAEAGAKLFAVDRTPILGKLHHKIMVIDKQVIIAGSFNYTSPATRLNDENIIIIGNIEETRAKSIEAQKRLGQYVFAEINRIIEDHGEKFKIN